MPKITKRVVDALKPSVDGKELVAWDSDMKGFGVRIMPSGVGSYFVYYRNAQGRQRRLALGRVGTMTPDEARQLAREKLTDASKGNDPSAERQQIRKAITVSELCDLYLASAAIRLKPKTFGNNRSHLERHVKPLIGNRSVASLTHADIAKLQGDIIAGKTARPREGRGGVTSGGRAVASRTIVVFGSVLEYAIRRKIISENVMRGVERPPERKQKRFLSIDEIGRLGSAMQQALADHDNPVALAAIRFLLLSGCRRMEALSLPLALVDRQASCIRFADTKTGAQIRPLGASAIAVLDQVASRGGWVFPADKGSGHFVGLPKVLDRLCSRAGLDGVTVHVLRHSFAAAAAEMGFSELTIAGLLGHTVPGVTARYAHVPDSALVIAANRVSDRIAAALNAEEAPSKVVELSPRAL